MRRYWKLCVFTTTQPHTAPWWQNQQTRTFISHFSAWGVVFIKMKVKSCAVMFTLSERTWSREKDSFRFFYSDYPNTHSPTISHLNNIIYCIKYNLEKAVVVIIILSHSASPQSATKNLAATIHNQKAEWDLHSFHFFTDYLLWESWNQSHLALCFRVNHYTMELKTL